MSMPIPISAATGRVALIHNGIVENYLDIKAMLLKEGYTFQSETRFRGGL